MQRQRYTLWIVLLVQLAVGMTAAARSERDTLSTGPAASFTANEGQWDARIRYAAQLHNAALFLEADAITVALRQPLSHPAPAAALPRCHAYRMTFPGAQATLPQGTRQQPGYSNYLLGNDPARWRSRVPSYSLVTYPDIYPGIDLEILSAQGALKYNFLVAPGADPSAIAIAYSGTDGLRIDRKGNLVVRTSVRDVVELKPYAYQSLGGKQVEVPSRWEVRDSVATIALGPYDTKLELVIDPVLIFSTYTGAIADNWGATAAYDSEKNAYTAGLVFDIGYPTSLGAYQMTPGGGVDIGIFKFDTLGTQRLYATYLGGASSDMPHSLFVNTFDELIVFGTTGSADFPVTPTAYQTAFAGGMPINYLSATIPYPNGSDIFVSRLSADGTSLLASTYIGGSGNDGLNYRNHYNNNYLVTMQGNDSLYYNYGDGARGEIITDNLNNIYLGSTTFSTDFPVSPDALQANRGGRQDGIVLKLDHNLRNLLWGTYFGGAGDDAVYSIDVDSAYNLLICGGTNSRNLPTTPGTIQTAYGGGNADGFVAKISYNGDRLIASTFIGANDYDQLYFVRTGRHDEVFLFGQTAPGSSMTFIRNAGYSVAGAGMLLARLKPDLSAYVWSTTFGTPGRVNLSPTAFAADICNRVYAAGWGRDFVGYGNTTWYTAGTTGMETTTGAWSDSTDGQDFYIIALDQNASQLDYATFFGELHDVSTGSSRGGGDHVDGGTSRFDRLATLYQSVCASCGGTNAFPITPGAWSDTNAASNCNNALFRFNVTDDFPVAEFIPPTAGCAPYTIQFRNTGRGTAFHWDFGDGSTSNLRNPSHTYSAGGIYTVTLIARLPGGCSEADTQRHTLHVIGTGRTFTPYISCSGSSVQIGPQPQIGATYEWLTPGVSDPTVANPWVSQAGVYLLRISATGCSEVDTFLVRTYNLIEPIFTQPVSCHDSADASIQIRITNGLLADSITLSVIPPIPFAFDGNRTFIASALPPGTYRISIAGYGCLVEQDITIENPSRPEYTKRVSDPLCSDSCTGWIHINYSLNGIPTDTIIRGLCEGSHVTLLTSDGCPIVDTTEITRNRSLDGFRAWADRTDIFLGESTTLHATDIPGATYLWTPASTVDRPTAPNTTATPADTITAYTVTATSGNCTATATVTINAKLLTCGEPDFSIPNAFTPNGDGINDVLDLSSNVLSELSIAIFNRWGQCVFRCDNPTDCRWDGRFNGENCLPGVYTYTCHIRCHNGVENDFKGDITLIR
ncbi:MAG: gliding motility-associated C-terminal domain-containing protein [Bacteroidales bacterium]|nr:gliding motility-associated C-terminal domain-containing protein [Bacteroidales bacterium]